MRQLIQTWRRWLGDQIQRPHHGICILLTGISFIPTHGLMVKKTTNSGLYVKGVTDGGQDDFYGIIQHIYELEYVGLTKKIPLFYCQWFDPTINVGKRYHSQYNIVEIKLSGRYALYDPFILPQKARKTYFVNFPNICKNLRGWCIAITKKSWGFVQVDHIKDELPYQAHETPVVLPVERIEKFQGLADTSIIAEVDDDHIEALVHDTDEDINISEEEHQENDNNN